MEYKSVNFKAEDVEGRIFRGYAATWDKDQGGDIIVPGAFAKTIAERGMKCRVMYNHKTLIGRPLELREEEKGLYTEGKISKTRAGDEVLELMRDGALDTMSITYSVPAGKAEYDEKQDARILKEIKLYEFGPVDFPMNEAAIITGVKSIRDAVRMGKGLTEEHQAELAEVLAELKALLKTEPPKGTQGEQQPPELAALKAAFANFGRVARH